MEGVGRNRKEEVEEEVIVNVIFFKKKVFVFKRLDMFLCSI